MSVNEESNSSYCNQAHNQLVAKNDKKVTAKTLYHQQKLAKHLTGKQHIHQYNLVINGIALVRQASPKMWQYSFMRVNLNPLIWLPFKDWCKKINHFHHAGKGFENEASTLREKFLLLPTWWTSMLPTERIHVMQVIEHHQFNHTTDCLQ